MWGAAALLLFALLLCCLIGGGHRALQSLHPRLWWRWWRQRAKRRFLNEMRRRWGDDPIPQWHHDERERAREIRLRRAHKTRY